METNDIDDVLLIINRALESMLTRVTEGLAGTDVMRVILSNPSLSYPVSIKLTLVVDRIHSKIQRVLQSFEEFSIEDARQVMLSLHTYQAFDTAWPCFRFTSGRWCVNLTNELEEAAKFQKVLSPYYQLNIISTKNFNSLIYSGPSSQQSMYLYHVVDHYHCITSMT
ncbi:uncharacterized protein LOC144347829, partial [Saccoglossus kowalevskii]